MQLFNFAPFTGVKPPTILLLGAHSDDIEIGCGGSILRLIEQRPDIVVWWVVFSAAGKRGEEAQASANLFLQGVQTRQIVLKDFRDGFLPYDGSAVKEQFEELKLAVSPDIIFTHTRHDLHQDHRLLCELTWNTWRDHLILEYEIPKYDGDLGAPNFFIHLDERISNKKINYLLQCFQTQQNKHWFTADTFQALMHLRGVESRAPDNYAEGFYGRKIVF
jgi:LmbE family N-acetylglucosaminyl deacetylase